MALFGYPLAHENDAERAVRAALSIQRALADLNRRNAGAGKPKLIARIGLETGPAVVDAAGEIYGDVANIAARVQALAEPSAVLVTAGVLRQVAGLLWRKSVERIPSRACQNRGFCTGSSVRAAADAAPDNASLRRLLGAMTK